MCECVRGEGQVYVKFGLCVEHTGSPQQQKGKRGKESIRLFQKDLIRERLIGFGIIYMAIAY